ncbi:MAG: excinuclease ABC subunit UvrC [Candidatus Marinimicrobia bacterium]|nr:excinuclease ABC subunit UvrC [Candidatus Neomarinimicrobiota bacterium]MCF7840752.1 excinuclease ABC subunit UvrC [Candidatus Neomarinimicrobiota bacterium]MCF7902760.1 excinuclease ABC subunit UvrC [Candidatus Neomarinimicrobiota bacterium]
MTTSRTGLPAPEAPIWEKLKRVPKSPGVYFYKNQQGKIIYIGKAKVLRNRVRSYFTGTPDNPKTAMLVSRIWDMETIVTRSDVEALLTEATLIKEHHPKYNVDLRDDKSYPYIRITNEDFPQVFVTRKIEKDGSIYYGPYTNVKTLRASLAVIRNIFTIRSCKYNITDEAVANNKIQLCLDYHIKRCDGPCQGLISKADYGEMITRVEAFLKGDTTPVEQWLEAHMQQASENLVFEEAARFRDQLNAVRNYAAKQRLKTSDFNDRDVIALARQENLAVGMLLRIRSGKLIGKEHFFFKNADERAEGTLLGQLLTRLYTDTVHIPREILVPGMVEDGDIVEKWLWEQAGYKVQLHIPRIGEKRDLMSLGERNAELMLAELVAQQKLKVEFIPKMVRALQDDLQLNGPPRRIEGFDISHLGGTETVASMVCFIDAKPAKKEYRKFQIKTVQGIDDFASMREVVHRRYSRVRAEALPEPDLILIDGGKGQLSAAKSVLTQLGLDHIPILGLAKRLEEVFIPGHPAPLGLPKTSPSVILLRRIRDEAHRFAITFQRKRRGKKMVKSALDNISGIGPKRRLALIQHFKSVQRIKNATVEEIMAVPGISRPQAERIKNALS